MKQLLLFFLLGTLCSQSQIQIGTDINGEAAEDQNGYSVSLSSNGSIIAIGAIFNDGNGSNSGHVRIYENQSGNWTQIGQDINGEAADDQSGHSVSLSSDGSIVAIGAIGNTNNGIFSSFSGHVRIYENQSGNWTQIGSDINSEASVDQSGWSISLSSDGSIVAIGAITNDGNGLSSGHVRIYENQSGNWTQIGQDIDGEAETDQSGWSISLSSDGSIVAIGAPGNADNGNFSGHVRIYENQSGNWTQIGQDIDGEAQFNQSGRSVSLSSDGSIVAIGAIGNADNGNFSGHVRIYENQSGNWTQIGQDIDGEASSDTSGFSISLSSDGSIVAISAISNDGNGSNSGHVRIYENQSGNWTQIGQDINGEAAEDQSGHSVSLSSDGSIVAIGAITNDGNGSNSGHVRVYDLSALILSVTDFNTTAFKVINNIETHQLQLQLRNQQLLQQVNLYTVDGKYLYSIKALNIDTSSFSSGIYILEVVTNKGKSAKKVIIN